MKTNLMVEENAVKVIRQPELEEAKSDSGQPAIAARREALLNAVSSCELNTIETRVAWLMNHFPNTRNSDLALLTFPPTFRPG